MSRIEKYTWKPDEAPEFRWGIQPANDYVGADLWKYLQVVGIEPGVGLGVLRDIYTIRRPEMVGFPDGIRAVIVASAHDGPKKTNIDILARLAGWNIPIGSALPTKVEETIYQRKIAGIPAMIAAMKVLQHNNKEKLTSVGEWSRATGMDVLRQIPVMEHMLQGIFLRDYTRLAPTGAVVVLGTDVMLRAHKKDGGVEQLYKYPDGTEISEIHRGLCTMLANELGEPITVDITWGGATLTYPQYKEESVYTPGGMAGQLSYVVELQPFNPTELALFVYGLKVAKNLKDHTGNLLFPQSDEVFQRLLGENPDLSSEQIKSLIDGAGQMLYRTNGGWQMTHWLTHAKMNSINGIQKNAEGFKEIYAGMVSAAIGAPWQLLHLLKKSASWHSSGSSRGNIRDMVDRAAQISGLTQSYAWNAWFPPLENGYFATEQDI